jgi:hypothetical protein
VLGTAFWKLLHFVFVLPAFMTEFGDEIALGDEFRESVFLRIAFIGTEFIHDAA